MPHEVRTWIKLKHLDYSAAGSRVNFSGGPLAFPQSPLLAISSDEQTTLGEAASEFA